MSRFTWIAITCQKKKHADKVIKKLEEKIEFAGKMLAEKPADKLDEIANNTAEDFITAYGEAIEIVKGGWMNE